MTAHEASPDWPFDKLMCTCSCATRGRAEVERLKGLLAKDRARRMEESDDEFIHAALDYIRSQERERCAKIAEMEPELPGDMPEEMRSIPLEDALRLVVRVTKKCIAANIRK